MLDRYLVSCLKTPLAKLAAILQRRGWHADTVTVLGFASGLAAIVAVALGEPLLGPVLLLLGRLAEGTETIIAFSSMCLFPPPRTSRGSPGASRRRAA